MFPDHSCLLTAVAVTLPVSWCCIWEYYSHELNLISCVAEKQRCQTVSVGVGTRPTESYVVQNSISQNFPPSVHVEAFFPQFVIHKICLNMNVEVLQICEENSRSYTVFTILYIWYLLYNIWYSFFWLLIGVHSCFGVSYWNTRHAKLWMIFRKLLTVIKCPMIFFTRASILNEGQLEFCLPYTSFVF